MMKSMPILLMLIVAIAGCESATESALEKQRAALTLSQEPSGALTPTEAMEAIDESAALTLAGSIHAGEIDPFQAGQASFMMTQLPDEGHGADDPDHADNCPFCKRRLEKAPKAIVQFKDENGEVLKWDAKQLFGVDKGDSVVVVGNVQYQEATNTLTVDATGIFKR